MRAHQIRAASRSITILKSKLSPLSFLVYILKPFTLPSLSSSSLVDFYFYFYPLSLQYLLNFDFFAFSSLFFRQSTIYNIVPPFVIFCIFWWWLLHCFGVLSPFICSDSFIKTCEARRTNQVSKSQAFYFKKLIQTISSCSFHLTQLWLILLRLGGFFYLYDWDYLYQDENLRTRSSSSSQTFMDLMYVCILAIIIIQDVCFLYNIENQRVLIKFNLQNY